MQSDESAHFLFSASLEMPTFLIYVVNTQDHKMQIDKSEEQKDSKK